MNIESLRKCPFCKVIFRIEDGEENTLCVEEARIIRNTIIFKVKTEICNTCKEKLSEY